MSAQQTGGEAVPDIAGGGHAGNPDWSRKLENRNPRSRKSQLRQLPIPVRHQPQPRFITPTGRIPVQGSERTISTEPMEDRAGRWKPPMRSCWRRQRTGNAHRHVRCGKNVYSRASHVEPGETAGSGVVSEILCRHSAMHERTAVRTKASCLSGISHWKDAPVWTWHRRRHLEQAAEWFFKAAVNRNHKYALNIPLACFICRGKE